LKVGKWAIRAHVRARVKVSLAYKYGVMVKCPRAGAHLYNIFSLPSIS
jgi:hypothetical protein